MDEQQNVQADTIQPEPSEQKPDESKAKPSVYEGEYERFRGKAPEDIVKSYQELEKLHGTKASKLGELEKEVEAYRLHYQAQQHQQQQRQEPPEKDTSYDEKFYESPTQAAKELFKKELGQYGQMSAMQTVGYVAPLVKAQAMNTWPDVFEGVDDKSLTQAMFQMGPQAATDPNMWRRVAWVMQGERSGYKMPNSPNPPNPDNTDLPPQVKGSRSSEPVLPKEVNPLLELWGVTDEKSKKQVAADLARDRRDRLGEYE